MRPPEMQAAIDAQDEADLAWRRFCRAAQDNQKRQQCDAALAEWEAACRYFDRLNARVRALYTPRRAA